MEDLRGWLFRMSRRLFAALRSVQKYSFFVLQIVGWTLVLYLLVPLLASFMPLFFTSKTQLSPSDFILLITAAFVLAYTYQTQKLKDETIFQRRMSAAHDVRFRMVLSYEMRKQTWFAQIVTRESNNNVCKFIFVTAIVNGEIGRCDIFQNRKEDHQNLTADYHIETLEGRKAFLQTLQLNNGEIKARILVTNGETFLYTYRATTDNWKRALNGEQGLRDDFILVKKELDEY